MTHHHTRSDYPQATSPQIPSPRPHNPLTKCGPAIERRIREMLTWHAGDCGLITDEAKDRIARMFFDGTIDLDDLFSLANFDVYLECCIWIEAITSMRKATT